MICSRVTDVPCGHWPKWQRIHPALIPRTPAVKRAFTVECRTVRRIATNYCRVAPTGVYRRTDVPLDHSPRAHGRVAAVALVGRPPTSLHTPTAAVLQLRIIWICLPPVTKINVPSTLTVRQTPIPRPGGAKIFLILRWARHGLLYLHQGGTDANKVLKDARHGVGLAQTAAKPACYFGKGNHMPPTLTRARQRTLCRIVAAILSTTVLMNTCQPLPAAPTRVHRGPRQRFFAVASYTLGMQNASAPDTVGEVAFFDTRVFGYVGVVPVSSYPFVCVSPTGGGFLVATAKSRGDAIVQEYSPTLRAVFRTKLVGAYLGNPNPGIFCPFKIGPDGVLWLINRQGLRGVHWPSLRRICSYPGTLREMLKKIGNPLLIPIKGGVLMVNTLPLVNPMATAQVAPRMYLLSESGHLRGISLPSKLRGIPTVLSVRGRTVAGFTATQVFFRYLVGKRGRLLNIATADLPAHLPHRILAFHQISRTVGAAMASGGGRYPRSSEIYLISIRTGKVLKAVRVPIAAETMVMLGRKFCLVAAGGAVTEVSKDGRILRTSTGPFSTVDVVGGAR